MYLSPNACRRLTHAYLSCPRPVAGYRVHPVSLQHRRLHLLQSPPAPGARAPVPLCHQPHFPALHQVLPEGDLPPRTQVLSLLPHLPGFPGGQGERHGHSRFPRVSAHSGLSAACHLLFQPRSVDLDYSEALNSSGQTEFGLSTTVKGQGLNFWNNHNQYN